MARITLYLLMLFAFLAFPCMSHEAVIHSEEYKAFLSAHTKPYEFSLGGLSDNEIERLKSVPGVLSAKRVGNRVNIVWQPYEWAPDWREVEGTQEIFKFLIITKRLGNTSWLRGGAKSSSEGTIIIDQQRRFAFGITFQDYSTGRSEVMKVYLFPDPQPGQVEHEMLRGVVTDVSIEKCGDGYAIVSRAGRGTFVVWQVSDKIFVRIDNSYDPEMVAAYINKLGSIVPKDYKIDLEKWVENEVRWRLIKIDFKNNAFIQPNFAGFYSQAEYLVKYFPDVESHIGKMPDRKKDHPMRCYEWLNQARYYLWANRDNFKYDNRTRGYILKGPNKYDPANPPELPEEIKCPPPPSEDRIEIWKKANAPKDEEPEASEQAPVSKPPRKVNRIVEPYDGPARDDTGRLLTDPKPGDRCNLESRQIR